jgi:ankyrin repeat domain-containing protein 50
MKGDGENTGPGRLSAALLEAAAMGRAETVRELLRGDGVDVNAASRDGETALLVAAMNGHGEVVRELLRCRGIDVHAKDQDGNRPKDG